MLKKFISLAILSAFFAVAGFASAYSAEPEAVAAKPAEKVVDAKAASAATEKQTKKTAALEEEKYPIVYAKCTKEAETDETKYDQIFDECMEKNGFPSEEFSTGGLPIDSGEDE